MCMMITTDYTDHTDKNMSHDCELSVILPAYNEGQAMLEAVEQHAASLSKLRIDYQVLIVNDGSKDRTSEFADEAAKRYPAVRILTNPTNRGQVASIVRGFAESRGRVVMHNGVDLPFDPSEIGRVMEEIHKGADVVVVERLHRQAYGWFRRSTSW